jgi:RNA polymerase sigma-70 factor (ECF subfamily)
MDYSEFENKWLPLNGNFYRVAFYILEDENDAMDIVQNLYLKLWNGRDRLDEVSNPLGYGITLTKNLCLDKVRSSISKRTERIDEKAEIIDTSSPETIILDKERIAMVLDAIEKLPDKQKLVLKMRLLYDMPYDKISKLTGLSELNIRVLVSIARKTLRNKIAF